MTTDALANELHRASGHVGPFAECSCPGVAARLAAAGVTCSAESDQQVSAATPAPLPIEPYERECMVRDAEKGVAPAGSSMTRAEWDRRYLLERLAELRGGR